MINEANGVRNRGSIQDALREVAFAVVVATISAVLALSLANGSFLLQEATAFGLSVFGVPVVGALVWAFARRLVPWYRAGLLSWIGAAIGAILWLPTFYQAVRVTRDLLRALGVPVE